MSPCHNITIWQYGTPTDVRVGQTDHHIRVYYAIIWRQFLNFDQTIQPETHIYYLWIGRCICFTSCIVYMFMCAVEWFWCYCQDKRHLFHITLNDKICPISFSAMLLIWFSSMPSATQEYASTSNNIYISLKIKNININSSWNNKNVTSKSL